jgi:hypothetical protein
LVAESLRRLGLAVTVSIDTSLLISYYNSKAGILNSSSDSSGAGGTTSTGAPAVQYAPTAPWQSGNGLNVNALVQSAMNGQNFINENAAKLDMPGASDDYKKLFALYQGLDTLSGIATQAAATNVDPTQMKQYQQAFARGLSQVTDYTDTTQLSQLRLTTGQTMLDDLSTIGAPATFNTTYTTGTLMTGATSDVVPAFAGDAQFDMTVKRQGVTQDIHMDLSDMGSTPRSMANVVNYMNGKLKAAGLTTTFSINRTTAAPRTLTVGTQTVTLPAVGDALALQINGDSAEQVTFSASATPAVYVTTQSGDPDPDANVATNDGILQSTMVKVDPNGDTPAATRLDSTQLQGSIGTVHATQVGPDGSVYMLADVSSTVNTSTTDPATGKVTTSSTAATVAGQTLQGKTDVALIKYDSAGHLVYTRTLGASTQATGLGLAVSSTGQVAITGSTTSSTTAALQGATDGPLNSATGSGYSDSFVSLYDANGDETWTAQRGSQLADKATAVAFGSDGVVYVAGTTNATMPNGGEVGGQDSYLTAFATDSTGAPKALFTQQFGTTGTDTPSGIAVDGNTVYVAANENGEAVVRSFQTANTVTTTTKAQSGGNLVVTVGTATGGTQTGSTSTTYPAGTGPDYTTSTSVTSAASVTAGATRDLGSLTGGSLAGISLSDGKLYIAGQTRNGALDIANTTRPYDALMDGFAASISTDLTSQADDNLAYYGGAGNNTVTGMSVANGQVWITGSAGADLPDQTMVGKAQGYIAGLDVATGTVSGAQLLSGKDGISTGTSIAVDATGASDLDKFGLPKGTITYGGSQNVVSSTSVRPGDQFQIRTSATGQPITITIAANDTFKTLAAKIGKAAGFAATVTVASNGTQNILKIAPASDSNTVEIMPGPNGKNALPALGLTAGVARNTTINKAGQSVSTARGGQVYGLGLDSSINLSDKASITHAQSILQLALTKIKTAYQGLVTAATPASAQPKAITGTVPAYITAQIANYQAGLDRLTGAS